MINSFDGGDGAIVGVEDQQNHFHDVSRYEQKYTLNVVSVEPLACLASSFFRG
jgi:hypothetical protein